MICKWDKPQTVREQAESLLRTNDEQLKHLELSIIDGATTIKLSEAQRYVATHMFLWGAMVNASSEQLKVVYEAFRILGLSDDEIATDIIGG